MIERRDEELSHIYRDAEGARPAQRVDDNILAASQRVAGNVRRPAVFGFARRWGAPVAIAATVLVTSTLALMVYERQSGPDTIAPKAPRADRPAKVLPAEPKRAEQGTAAPLVLRPIAPAPPIPQSAPAFVPGAPPFPEVSRKREEAKPAPAAPAPGANLYSSERAGATQRTPVPEAQRAFDVQQRIRPMQAPPGAAPGAGALSQSAVTREDPGVAPASASRLVVSEARERTPEKWLEDIRKLKTEGKTPEAERELGEFRKRYPDYILPEDLR
jgi:hypothetical protein